MKVINVAYAVLNDPKQRAAHDAWINNQLIEEAIEEAMAGVGRQKTCQSDPSPKPTLPHPDEPPRQPPQPSTLVRFNNWMGTPAGTKFGVGAIGSVAFLVWVGEYADLRNRPLKSIYPVQRTNGQRALAAPSQIAA